MLVFVGYRTTIARYVAKRGIAQMCLCETKYQGGGIAPFWGSANLPEKVSRDMGYRSDSIAVSRDMGPLRLKQGLKQVVLIVLLPEGEYISVSMRAMDSTIRCFLVYSDSTLKQCNLARSALLLRSVVSSRSMVIDTLSALLCMLDDRSVYKAISSGHTYTVPHTTKQYINSPKLWGLQRFPRSFV